MARPSPHRVPDKEKAQLSGELVRALRGLRNAKEISRFLHELLTPGEVYMLGRRIRVARGLLSGDTYAEISYREKVSFSTIQLVDRAIEHGLHGYRRAIRKGDLWAENMKKREARASRGSPYDILRRTPGLGPYRFWLNLFADASEKAQGYR